MFIVFEGPDHAGKSTLVNMLCEELSKEYKIWKTREPGGTPIGEAVREILKNPEFDDMTDVCEEFLFAAIRHQHCKAIHEKLDEQYTVISDRFVQSSYVYQGILNGDSSIVYRINNIATRGTTPDLVIIVTCTVDESIKRGAFNDRIEMSKTREDLAKIHDEYFNMYEAAKFEGECWYLLDTTNKTVEESYNELLDIINSYKINFTRESN